MDHTRPPGNPDRSIFIFFMLNLKNCKGLFWFLHNHDIIMGKIHYNVKVIATF